MTHTYRRVEINTANIKLILGHKASKPEGSKCAVVTRRASCQPGLLHPEKDGSEMKTK